MFEEEEGVTFPNFAIEPDAVAEIWPDYEIAPERSRSSSAAATARSSGGGTLEKYGWKVGDTVTLKGTVFPVDLTFQIVGEIPNERAPHFWFQREYLEQAVRGRGRRPSTSSARSGCASTTRARSIR